MLAYRLEHCMTFAMHSWTTMKRLAAMLKCFYKTKQKQTKNKKHITMKPSFQHGLLANVNKPLDWYVSLDHLK